MTTMRKHSTVFQVFILVAIISSQGVMAFQGQRLTSNYFVAKKYALKSPPQRNDARLFRLHLSENENENDAQENDESVSAKGDFDGKGFANYLAPYALALVGSIAVTVAFFKFVLLDY
jgi:hypothetical protein